MALEDFIKKFEEIKVLVMGDAMLDIYIKGDASRISPEAPVPVVKVSSIEYFLGGAANVANNVKSLDAKVYFVGIVGCDDYGEKFLSLLNKRGIEFLGLKKEIPTIVKARVIARNQQMIRYDIEEYYKNKYKKEITDKIIDLKDKFDVIILSDYAKGFFTKDLCKNIIKVFEDKPIIVDPKPVNADKFKNATIMCPNQNEARQIAKNDDDLIKIGKKIVKKYNLKYLVITRGEDGLFVTDGKEHKNYLASAKEVYDVTGCGDTVTAVLSLCIASGLDIFNSSYIANKAGGIVAGKFGTATLSREELINSLKND